MENCLFCKIGNGSIPSKTLYEDDIVKVFLDINPNSPGHTLIIPKKHFKDFDDIDLETLNHIMKVAKDIKNLIEDKLNPSGIKFVNNYGSLQEVKHYHLHIIPYYDDKKELSIEEVYELLK